MASVPSIGCLLARNQYYRKSSVSSVSSLTGSDSINFIDDDKSQQGLPEVAESTWWFKFFFHSEPVLSNVRIKDLSATGSLSGRPQRPFQFSHSRVVKSYAKLCHCLAGDRLRIRGKGLNLFCPYLQEKNNHCLVVVLDNLRMTLLILISFCVVQITRQVELRVCVQLLFSDILNSNTLTSTVVI
ncbi:PREDICTED: pancreatic progenitor cell differentiation and proliferation factor-like protein isoform X1 [Colobus angolensis palliatus]|nr:PREDICTED: pancreatic progenitor cell differentiation and proliferation factor-like protein isoform X1 [Colobus angolensis palliatus]